MTANGHSILSVVVGCEKMVFHSRMATLQGRAPCQQGGLDRSMARDSSVHHHRIIGSFWLERSSSPIASSNTGQQYELRTVDVPLLELHVDHNMVAEETCCEVPGVDYSWYQNIGMKVISPYLWYACSRITGLTL
ncbi:hypothetical protein BTVI_46342 [Pitangus sulphuratus]|nr:hypothetical protein BTVI_46342 [Pitangus sulphuratus]